MVAIPFDSYLPYDAGPGGNVTEAQWRDMFRQVIPTGIATRFQPDRFECFADATGMQVKVKAGEVFIRGQWGKTLGERTLPIAAADPTNPRIDRVIIRNDFTNNRMELDILTGTPGVSPVAPSLTQSTALWEISLATVAVGAGVTTILSTNVTKDRVSTVTDGRPPLGYFKRSGNHTIPSGVLTPIQWNAEDLDTDNAHETGTNNNRYTVKTAGYYRVDIGIMWAGNSANVRDLSIRKNGVATDYVRHHWGNPDANNGSQGTGGVIPVPFAEGEFLEVWVLQGSGGNLDVVAGSDTWWTVQWVSNG